MPSPIITLTTDFGTVDSYVAQMKGAIRGIDSCYADRPDGTLIAIVGSSGRLEIAVSGENAAAHTKLSSGETVRVVLPEGFSHG